MNLKEKNLPQYQIEIFQSQYQNQVIGLIDKSLKDLNVIPESDQKIDDEDLRKIPEIYSGRGRFWVAVEGNNVIGTIAIRDTGNNVAKLNRMFTDSKYYGQGVGQSLLDCAIEFAKEEGFQEIILNTHVNMQRAHRFYEKNGFVKTGKDADKFHYSKKLL